MYIASTAKISIHALRVEGDTEIKKLVQAMPISIHALRVEGDKLSRRHGLPLLAFLSTPSGWRAT